MAQGKVPSPSTGLLSLKFDIALNLNPARKFLDNTTKEEFSSGDKLLFSLLADELQDVKIGTEVIGMLFEKALNTISTKPCENDIQDLKIALEVLHIQEEHLLSNCSNSIKEKRSFPTAHEELSSLRKSLPSEYYILRKLIGFLEEGVSRLRFANSVPNNELLSYQRNLRYESKSLSMVINVLRNFVILTIQPTNYLMTKDQFIMCYNKALEILNQLTLIILLEGTIFPVHFNKKYLKLLRIMIGIVRTQANQSYTIFKVTEIKIGSTTLLRHISLILPFVEQYP